MLSLVKELSSLVFISKVIIIFVVAFITCDDFTLWILHVLTLLWWLDVAYFIWYIQLSYKTSAPSMIRKIAFYEFWKIETHRRTDLLSNWLTDKVEKPSVALARKRIWFIQCQSDICSFNLVNISQELEANESVKKDDDKSWADISGVRI